MPLRVGTYSQEKLHIVVYSLNAICQLYIIDNRIGPTLTGSKPNVLELLLFEKKKLFNFFILDEKKLTQIHYFL